MINGCHFLWGAGTAPYQVEGGIINNDWDFFTSSEPIKKRISRLTRPNIFYKNSIETFLQPAGNATKFWDPRYYEKDFDLAKDLGLNAFRIGIEWARVEPERGHWDQEAIEHYKEMIKAMRIRGLIPVITLNHITLPLWVLTPPSNFTKRIAQNLLPRPLNDLPLGDPPPPDLYWKSLKGWENNETVEEFIKYVERMVAELKDQVDYWITIGEPVASVIGGGYLAGLWPPGFFLDGDRAKTALHNLIEAHIQAYNKIKLIDDIDSDEDGLSSRVGFSHLIMQVIPAKSSKILGISTKDNIKASKNFAYFINEYFVNAVINGEEDLNYLDTLQIKNIDSKKFIIHNDWKDKADFIGLDYYRRVPVYFSNIVSLSSAKFVGGVPLNNLTIETNHPHGILNDLGWEVYPRGLYNSIMLIKTQCNKPILIVENGIADKSDKYRAPFIIAHLHSIRQAINDGALVLGYLYWSFTDNYEWLDNYRPEGKFGLFSINFDSNHKNGRQYEHLNLTRHKTKGAEALQLIIRESIFQSKDGVVTESAIEAAAKKFGRFAADGSHIIQN
ncbi:MAG TPA: family 1 glycosylhydrolase [Nitrososphaeraceae archaeon]